jgi:hypothetical protein
MPNSLNTVRYAQQIVIKMVEDLNAEIPKEIQRNEGINDETTLIKIIFEHADRIMRRELKTMDVIEGDSREEIHRKLELVEYMGQNLGNLLSPHLDNVVSYGCSEFLYYKALRQVMEHSSHYPSESQHVFMQLIGQIKVLKKDGKESVSDLTKVLSATSQLLDKKIDLNSYVQLASSMDLSPSAGLIILGHLMHLLCLALEKISSERMSVALTGLSSAGWFAKTIDLSKTMHLVGKETQIEATPNVVDSAAGLRFS